MGFFKFITELWGITVGGFQSKTKFTYKELIFLLLFIYICLELNLTSIDAN